MSTENFNRYAELYDLFNDEKNYIREANIIASLIEKHSPNARSIIEFGSGSGIHSKLLSEKGYSILGLEKSDVMLEQARARQTNRFKCLKADVSEVKLFGKFDVALSLFHVFSYMNDDTSIDGFFENAIKNLKPGGILIFDFWFTSGVMNLKPEVREKIKENDELTARRKATPHIDYVKNIVNVVYDFNVISKRENSGNFNFTENHPMRHFGIPEIKNYANKFGFDFVDTISLSTLSRPTLNDWDCGIILKKLTS